MTAPISAIDMYNILRVKIGEQEAKTLTDFVAQQAEEALQNKISVLATKDDITAIRADMATLRAELKEQKADILKWMVGLFIPLYLSIIGLIITLLLRH